MTGSTGSLRADPLVITSLSQLTLGWFSGEQKELVPPYLAVKGLMSIDLGLPTLPPPTLARRRKSRQIRVGKVAVGGDAPIDMSRYERP